MPPGWSGWAPAGDERLALATDHPRWVVEAWRDALGDDTELEPALLADDAAPEVHLVARRVSREQLVEESGGEPGPWSPYAVRLAGGDPGRLAAVRSGAAAVQDEGSQLAALLLARAPLEGPDAAWLDMCAGPGREVRAAGRRPARRGAADRGGPGAAPGRAGPLGAGRRAGRRGARGRRAGAAVGGRLVRPGAAGRPVHRAGCAAPAARGALAAHGGGRRPARASSRGSCSTSALASVRPGGVVAYVTCSPHTAETVDVVAEAAARDDVEVLPVAPLFPEVPEMARGEYGQLWPHRHGTDAMFMALLRRTR